MTTIDLDRMLGDRIRTAIHDPARYTDRRGAAEDHGAEQRSEWTARAVVLAIEGGLFELEQRAGHAQTPVPGPESAADGLTALPDGPGGVETPNGAHGGDERPCPQKTPHAPHGWAHAWPEQGANAGYDYANRTCPGIPNERNDAGLLAFIVRDLMDAAGYQYDPGRPLAEQARECGQVIRDFREGLVALQVEFGAANQRYAAETQRLTDLVDELRKQLAGADRHTEQLQQQLLETRAELQGMRKIVMDKDEALDEEHERVANLDRLIQERDHLLAAACPCTPGAPVHEHLTGGYALEWMTEATP